MYLSLSWLRILSLSPLPSISALSVSPALLLSFSVYRISLQLDNIKRRKKMLQGTVVAPPYVSWHDLVARV